MTQEIDRIDRNILRIMQVDGRISNVDLSGQIGLSPAPCLARVRKLEKSGYITGYKAQLNPELLGLSLLAFVEITLDRTTPDVFDRFQQAVRDVPEIEECQMVAGGFDYLLKVRSSDMDSYRKILGDRIATIPGILQTHTYVVMEQVKCTERLNI